MTTITRINREKHDFKTPNALAVESRYLLFFPVSSLWIIQPACMPTPQLHLFQKVIMRTHHQTKRGRLAIPASGVRFFVLHCTTLHSCRKTVIPPAVRMYALRSGSNVGCFRRIYSRRRSAPCEKWAHQLGSHGTLGLLHLLCGACFHLTAKKRAVSSLSLNIQQIKY